MHKTIAKMSTISLVLGLCTLCTWGCTPKNTDAKTPASSDISATASPSTEKSVPPTAQEDLKLIGTTPEHYASSEEKMLNMLNEPDQLRLQKAIQIVSNHVAETLDLYTEEDEIDFDKWHAVYCKKVNGLTFNGMIQLAEQILKESKQKNITHLQDEIADLKTNPAENQEESLLFLQEELEKAKELPSTVDTYIYSEECFI